MTEVSQVFNHTEQAVIHAVKTKLRLYLDTKGIFWNGITKDMVIAGGWFASTFKDEAPKDLDVFILNNNKEVYDAMILNLSFNSKEWQIREDASQYLQNPHIKATALNLRTKAQYILTDYTSREDLLKSFDYRHCTVSYDAPSKVLYITRGAYDDIINRTLTHNGDNTPRLWRKDKFEGRGWKYPVTATSAADELLKSYLQLASDMATPVSAMTGDYSQALQDSYSKTVLEAIQNMITNVNVKQTTPGSIDDMMQRHGTDAVIDYQTK